MQNRFTTRNKWFKGTIETIHTSGLTLIISTMWFVKTFTVEYGFNLTSILATIFISLDWWAFHGSIATIHTTVSL